MPQSLYAYNGKIKMGILPLLFFQNGHTYFTQKLHERRNIVPYVVRAPPERRRRRRRRAFCGDPAGDRADRGRRPAGVGAPGRLSMNSAFAA